MRNTEGNYARVYDLYDTSLYTYLHVYLITYVLCAIQFYVLLNDLYNINTEAQD